MNLSKINDYIHKGYIMKSKHPSADLYIYNYTKMAQYEHIWNDETLACRGLILDNNHNIVARPFPKFFNLEEREVTLPNENFEVFEKMDGSLGILYFLENKPFIATRGSFKSEQAMIATEILHTKYQHVNLHSAYTYLFEIIYPENRVVVDYGEVKDIILLGIVDTQTGKELPLDPSIGFPLVKKYDGIKDIHSLRKLSEDNREGFVIRFKNDYRVKVKFEEYVRLHRIMTNVNSSIIWEHLLEDTPIEQILENVPDEFYDWVKKVQTDLKINFEKIEKITKSEFKELATRKETALYFQTCTYPSLLFAMLDKKNYAPIIWKLVKPTFEKPFFKFEN